jgi:plasmid stabilization system protein ParE
MARLYNVDFTSVARRDLEAIVEFIATDDPVAATRILNAIDLRVSSLERMPQRGRVVPELAAFGIHTYRELIEAPWRIIYRIGGSSVFVLVILDGRRNVEDILLDRLLR